MNTRSVRQVLLGTTFLFTSACSTTYLPPCPAPPPQDVVYITAQGWHAEIGIPVSELGENLQFYKDIFPGASVIMFGYGKKTFVTAPPDTISEYVIGPFPGPAVIHVVGLTATPDQAYPTGTTLVLSLTHDGEQKLSEYLWNDLTKGGTQKPLVIAKSEEPAGLFYSAASEYNLMHTCNTWTAEALHQAGLNITGDNVTFSDQVMGQVDAVAREQCSKLM